MFDTYDERYQALVERDPQAEGRFYYCVLSTKIFCRPTCYSRLALRENIVFTDSTEQDVKDGFRPCMRCKPTVSHGWNSTREFVIKACALIYSQSLTQDKFDVNQVYIPLGISKWHFCRQFKNYTGKTPRQFYLQCKSIKINPVLLKPVPIIETKKNLKRKREEEGSDYKFKKMDLVPAKSTFDGDNTHDNCKKIDLDEKSSPIDLFSPLDLESVSTSPENNLDQFDVLFDFDTNYDEFFHYLYQDESFNKYLLNAI